MGAYCQHNVLGRRDETPTARLAARRVARRRAVIALGAADRRDVHGRAKPRIDAMDKPRALEYGECAKF